MLRTSMNKRRTSQTALDGGRGEKVATFEAKFHGQLPVSRPQGNDVVMHAVSKIHELKQRAIPVQIMLTTKGVYVDQKDDNSLMCKVPVAQLSWVCTDPRNKHLFSFLVHEPRLHTVECYTFSSKKNGKVFVTACNKLIADLIADGSRAEAELKMIESAVPIMPVQAERDVEEDYDDSGRLIRRSHRRHSHMDDLGVEELPLQSYIDPQPWVSDEYIKSSLGCFKAIYKGGIPVKEIEGFHTVQQAALRVKDFGLPPKEVTLVVTQAQLILVERDTGDHMHEINMLHVSYSLVDPRDHSHFYWIVNDPRMGFAYCHIVQLLGNAEMLPTCMAAAQRAVARHRRELASQDAIAAAATHGKRGKKTAKTPPLGVYEVKYLGGVRCDGAGNEVVRKALGDLRQQFQQMLQLGDVQDWTQAGDRVVLVMTADGIRVVDLMSGEVLFFVYIRDVAFSTHLHSGVDRKNNPEHDVFGFVAQDEKLNRHVCHLFKCPPGMARDICRTAAFAFKMCIEEMQRTEQENPFQASSKTDMDLSSLFPDHLIISRRDIKAIKVLGSGQFGTVWLALQRMRDSSSSKAVKHRAVKLLRPNASEQDQEDFLREAITMSRISHPNLVRLVGVSVNHVPWLVVLEFMRYGDLRNLLIACSEKKIEVTLAEQLQFMQSVCSGMAYLASKRLVHMDLACRNCLVGSNSQLKIGDFGLTRPFDEGKNYYKLEPNSSVKLPAKWLSVEALSTMTFSEKSDVWAAGVVFWEIVTYGSQPYPQFRNKEMRRKLKEGYRLEQPTDFACPTDLYELMTLAWEADPDRRICFADLGIKVQALLKAELARNRNKLRDIGLVVNGGVEKELPMQRETFVELYSQFTSGTANQGQYFQAYGSATEAKDDYVDVDGAGPDPQRTDLYLDVEAQGKPAEDDSYIELAVPEDEQEGSYMQIEQELRGDTLGDVSRSNPLFALIEDEYIDAVAEEGEDDGTGVGASYLAVAEAHGLMTEEACGDVVDSSHMQGDDGVAAALRALNLGRPS